MQLSKTSIRLLLALDKENKRVKPNGHTARVVTKGKELHFEELRAFDLVKSEAYPLIEGATAYSITEAGERHCRFALNAETIAKGKKGIRYENHP